VLADPPCQELRQLRDRAWCVLYEIRNVRRSRDLSFLEDAHLNAKKAECITAIIKHLLAGHDGGPCPAGERPIVSEPRQEATIDGFLAQHYSADFFCAPRAPASLVRFLRAVNRLTGRVAKHVITGFCTQLAVRPLSSTGHGKRGTSCVDISQPVSPAD
jgi:hypothetical protein